MKSLLMRIVDGIRSSFVCVRNAENVTQKEIEDPAFINECVEKDFAFLKSSPNSLPPIFHTLVFQRNKRELRVTSRNKSIASNFEKQKRIASDKEKPRNKRVTRVK
ncbi:hypothetical protein AVEN_123417-1 [Araneus ventricosus]|uniref:Uncharacterized protein n=1 Tax=Araneus ventricosus TaxID=182803 RepID=A0A4Y2T5X7_ARAVE|nr:hypothetical protein AVEN_148716-1 [Araneus ventricosus]GBN95635.1 hypothetical protein AVEN_123417-1 [Araneus ventricosus]